MSKQNNDNQWNSFKFIKINQFKSIKVHQNHIQFLKILKVNETTKTFIKFMKLNEFHRKSWTSLTIMNTMNIYENHRISLKLWISMKITETIWKCISMTIFEYHVKSMKQININNIYSIVNSYEHIEKSMKLYDNVYKSTNIIEVHQHVWQSIEIKTKKQKIICFFWWQSLKIIKFN